MSLESVLPIKDHLIVFTAQSKAKFYLRDAVCEYALRQDAIPLHPFRIFEYFLGNRVEDDLIRIGNNNLIRICDELWVFGETIADGVLLEIFYALSLKKQIKYHNIGRYADDIHGISLEDVKFERGVSGSKKFGGLKSDELRDLLSQRNQDAFQQLLVGGHWPKQMTLFDKKQGD